MNLNNFIENKRSSFNYRLIGVINEFSDNNMEECYVAYCLDPITHKWLKCKDEDITDIQNFHEEVIDSGKPHVLFYQRAK